MSDTKTNTCTDKEGTLPVCAPLAVPYVAPQEAAEPAFACGDALQRGTLFPGLDLPFMDYVPTGTLKGTPAAELMALDFVTQELALYLDTHPDDKEAFSAWKSFTALAEEGRRRYEEQFGPVTREGVASCPGWTWTDAPWSWNCGGK